MGSPLGEGEVKKMKMNDVVKRAKALRIKAIGVKKADLIRKVQKAEGNFDCFGTATEYCDQVWCCFREDCLPPKKVEAKRR
jgi:hypothetical protein